ncbi:MAG TPA: DUF1905 domain-containing protein [Fimbriimonadaceae bacterium]|nr:DUF1905 domain-containing protein [Fimbriimonadaceae bacterium]
MTLQFEGEVIYWKGPAPFLFVRVPEAESREIKAVERFVTYGWGCIPAAAKIGETEFTTALIPREGRYLLPVKVVVQRAEGVDEGHVVQATIQLDLKID